MTIPKAEQKKILELHNQTKTKKINSLLIRRVELAVARNAYIKTHNDEAYKDTRFLTKKIIDNLETEINEIDREITNAFSGGSEPDKEGTTRSTRGVYERR